MSLGESLLRGAAGGAASFIVGKMVAPYLWKASKTGISASADFAKSALKTSGIALGACMFAGAGYSAACWIAKKTDTSGEGYDLIIKGYNPATVESLHRYVPTATFLTSLTPLIYLTVRVFI